MRVLRGLLVQPFVCAGLAFVAFRVFLLDWGGQTLAGGSPSDVTDAALSVSAGVGLVAAIVSLAALPIAMWVIERRDLTLRQTMSWGIGIGNLPSVPFTAFGGAYGLAGLVRVIAFSSLLGLAGAACFWLISVRPLKGRKV